ncbi:MAG TPA: hypothetical protein PKO06_04250 [Candidatus Ozemobacteraceae bacterium]|nr:hypothetical protein [Candidatus Ozemobacteraceae bacterium]
MDIELGSHDPDKKNNVRLSMNLNRWHKICERLTKQANEAQTFVERTFGETHVPTYTGGQQTQKLEELASRGLLALELHGALLRARQTVRAAIGRANDEWGITERLVQVAAINERLNCLIKTFTRQHPNRVPVEEIERLFARADAARQTLQCASNADLFGELTKEVDPDDLYKSHRTYERVLQNKGADVQLMTAEEAAEIEKEILRLRGLKYRLQDEIAEANLGLVELDLPGQVVARVLG